MFAPVVLFVYNRLDHTMNVIESLQKNLLANQTDLYIFSDAAKNAFTIVNIKIIINWPTILLGSEPSVAVKIICTS